jgi:hypothetical protein
MLDPGFYEDMVRLARGTLKGKFMLGGFLASKPKASTPSTQVLRRKPRGGDDHRGGGLVGRH